VKPDISEFSYGYALTSEIVHKFSAVLAGAPVLPSLKDEGFLGYDLNLPLIGRPLFLQFKRSDYMVRPTAKGAGKVPVPHYRMNLRPLKHSDQHLLLSDMDAKGHRVFYATPEFHTSSDLNDVYLKKEVCARTAFWRPGDIGVLPDPGEHFVCFSIGAPDGYLYSEPKQVERTPFQMAVSTVATELADTQVRSRSGRDYLMSLGDDLFEIWSSRRNVARDPVSAIARIRETRDPIEYLGWIALSLFDCVAIVRPARRQKG